MAARARTTDPRATGADPRPTLRRSPGGATELPIQPTVSILISLGILREAAASTRVEVRPEVVDSRSSEVAETTGEGSRVAAGGGHGAAGNYAVQAGSTTLQEPSWILQLLKKKPSHLSAFCSNVVVVKIV